MIAMCYSCNVPLVCTFAFHKKEFYCLDCGRTYTFFGPASAEETPELVALMEQYEHEWQKLSKGLLSDGGMLLDDCETCKELYQPHSMHATEEEKKADRQARQRIKERVKVPA